MKKKIEAKDFILKIDKITKDRIRKEGVVSLKEYRSLNADKNPPTLLIIDDDESMRKSLKRIFEDEGYRTLLASDGTQLSQIIDGAIVDLILLDVGLPWINGYEIAELMKSHKDLKEIPLVFISGRCDPQDIKKGFSVGADDYIKKPFEVSEIKKAIHTLLALHK